MTTLAELEAAADLVHSHFPGTPQYAWPLLASRTVAEVWIKHENHTPIGAFKVRGGLVYMDHLKRSATAVVPSSADLVSASRAPFAVGSNS